RRQLPDGPDAARPYPARPEQGRGRGARSDRDHHQLTTTNKEEAMTNYLRKFAGVALGIGLASLSGLGAQAEVLKAAADPTIPPFAYRTVSGDVEGFNVDVGKAVAKQLGRDFELVVQEWSGIFAGVFTGHFDVIIAPMTITQERSKSMAFT